MNISIEQSNFRSDIKIVSRGWWTVLFMIFMTTFALPAENYCHVTKNKCEKLTLIEEVVIFKKSDGMLYSLIFLHI